MKHAANGDGIKPDPELTFQVGNGTDWFTMGITETFPNGYTPEPATALSLGLGALLVGFYRRFFGRV